MSTPTLPRPPIKLSWAERYRPERLFYLLLVSVILSTPANLLQALILQGPDSLVPSQWSQLYIVRMAAANPLAAIAIGLLAIALAIYGFRLDQRRLQKIEDKENQSRNEVIQPVKESIKQITALNQQIGAQTTEIHHILTQQSRSTSSLIPVKEIKTETLNLGGAQAATFPYRSTIFPDVYEQATRIMQNALANNQQPGLLVTGAPMAGKTRLAFQTMLECAPDWFTLSWKRGQTTELPALETLHGQHLILFIDDLQNYAESESGVDLASTTNDLPLNQLYDTLVQSAEQVVIVATCRATDLSRAETTASLRWLFESTVRVEIPFLTEEQKGEVIDSIKQSNAMKEIEDHTSDFDGTIGSLLLGLRRKRDQYLEFRPQRHPNHPCYLVLRAMKLLAVAGIPQHSKQRVRALAIQVLGGEELSKDETWIATCETLEERQFLTYTESALLIRKDVYFDKVITDYPKADKVHDALLQARRVFQNEGDSEALLALGWTHSKRREYQEMLETSTMTVELASSNARAHYAQGSAFLRLWKNEEALGAYDEAVKLNPHFADALYNKGIALIRLKRNVEAQAVFDEALAAVTLDPTSAPGWYNRGFMLNALNRYHEALSAYDEAIKLDARYVDAWYNKGSVLWKLKRHEEALTCLDQALVIDPRDNNAWMEKGNLLYDLKRYEDAIGCYEKILANDSQHTVAWNNKAAALSFLKRDEEALACCQKALDIDPGYVSALTIKGYILNALTRYEEALVCFDQAIAINPQSHNVWRHKGNALRGLHRYEEALVSFEKALSINHQYIEAWYDKGAVLRQLERDEEALEAYANAIFLQSQNIEGAYQDVEKATYEEALAAIDEEIALNPPPNADACYCKGCILGELERYEEALVVLDEALTLEPQSSYTYTWYYKGVVFEKLQRHTEALAAFDEAIKFDLNNVSAWYQKGVALETLGRDEEALAAYNETLKLHSYHALAWYHKGATLEKLHRHAESLAAFDEAAKPKSYSSTPGFGKYVSPDTSG